MDGNRFDDLTRHLATRDSRRGVLRTLAAMGTGGLLALISRGASADGCKGAGKACSKGRQCCSGICDPVTDTKSVAGSGSVCAPCGGGFQCVSGPGIGDSCGPRYNNCGELMGSCGNCNTNEVCVGGACACASNATQCPISEFDFGCFDTATDAGNCGGCGQICSGSQTCQAGLCVMKTCSSTGDCAAGETCLDGLCAIQPA